MTKDETQIRAQLERWFAAWSPGENAFDATALRPLFADGPIHVVDDFGDKVVTIDSFEGYAATWSPVMANFTRWTIRPHRQPDVQVSGDLTAVTFVFLGDGITRDGKATKAAQHATQVWRKHGDTWLIVHEHMTSDNPQKFED